MATAAGWHRKTLVSGVVIGSMSMATAGCTVAGGVLGAAMGSQFGDGGGRVVAAIVGAAAGAWIGNQIARFLDEEDQKKLAEATQETAVWGQPVSWTNPDTGVYGTTRVVGVGTRKETVAVPVLKGRVSVLPPFEYIGERYSVATGSNVRGGPGTDYKVVGSLGAGQMVDVIGRVEGKPWYLIGENGVGKGFVFNKLLKPTGQASKVLVNNDVTGPGVSSRQTVAQRNCRTIEQVVVLQDGAEQLEKIIACQGSNGWEVV